MISRLPPIHLGSPGEEISTKDLHDIAKRFKLFNQSRLLRVRDFLQPRQHDFLHLLPLLFHQNHPLLPGFVSSETPAGIPDYMPGKQAIEAAKRFSKGFTYNRKALRKYPIYSIFLMGSVGSMAFSKDSDIDIWICHQPDLSPAELEELGQKATLIEQWAATLKLEVHFFLVNSEQFKKGEHTPISNESSGETQHYLLLEEFYRTSIYIAGRVPMWWLVPPHQENNYAFYVAHLLENRFVFENEVLDLGGLQDMPVSEFVSATLWHIHKSLISPHKALLKLFLMESYAAELPEPQWLCAKMKQAIYQGEFSVDSLDPYFLIYEKVDGYLAKAGSRHRLNLARECFHIKIVGTSLASLDNRTRVLRENFMQTIAQRWDWPEELLINLGSQKFWTIKKASDEHGVIRDQLQQCLRIILQLTGNQTELPEHHEDLRLLSRKLRAFLDMRPGKIEVLTTRAMVYAKPDIWAIVEVVHGHEPSLWCLFDGRLPRPPLNPDLAIKQSHNLLELLCWAVVNGLYRRDVNLQLQSLSLTVTNNEIKRLLASLHGFLTNYLSIKETDLGVYSQPNRQLANLLLLNWGETLALDANSEQFMMSERSDPLSYGDNRHCFVQGIQKLSVSNWGEVTVQRYAGIEGIFDVLTEVFNQSARPLSSETLQVLCYTRGRGRSIALRVSAIFDRLLALFGDHPLRNSNRYLLPAKNGACCFRFQNDALGYYLLESNEQVLQELSSPQSQFSPVIFDNYVMDDNFIPFLYDHNLAGTVQIFCHTNGKQVAVYIIDERGSLFLRQHSGADLKQIMAHYSGFISTLQLQTRLPEDLSIKCYEIQKNSAGVISCHPVSIQESNRAPSDLRVRIVVDRNDVQTIYCNDRKFVMTDQASTKEIKEYILSFRKKREDYPLHITEIDVPCELLGLKHFDQGQSLHYLNYKQKIEEKLNI